ncbi:ribulose-phosphate 3-epimerase, cytoplasmic isoform-like [Stylophora pistillata]|uniref:ribulose-phosphate 3-epimerase, cytoplasmic isoform-like n=1 Tax=Stylophora pistillata TaxID=50429 RepID=UPI000C03E557|nr:ribulose-phosphate 3-epimerase, cytoplasmic isoform-like [Stylophora pistillata]XP_022801057.1 ribulose-phosphate 3-epimerase, cytoplasmic isoform-like [Stylophora pistillata]
MRGLINTPFIWKQQVKHLRTKYRVLDIEVDNGVGIPTIEAAARAGASVIVSGSVIIKSGKPKEVIDALRATTEKWIKINSETSQ